MLEVSKLTREVGAKDHVKSGASKYHSLNGAKPESHTMGNKLMLGMLLLVFFVFTNKAMGQFAGGSGTETDPYLVSTPDHLVQLFYYLGNDKLHFKMINDIDLTSYLAPGGAGHNGGAGWSPIGNASNIFKGTLNGAGFKIAGLWIDRGGTDYVGLFGNVGGTISNLGIEIATTGVKGNSNVGGLLGFCTYGTIINCYVTGTISGNSNIGGLMGCSIGSTITNCHTTGNVNGNGDGVGGLVGIINRLNYNVVPSTISNCYTTGNVSSNGKRVGGLLGDNDYNDIIIDCHATGNVSGSEQVGGLVGRIYCGKIGNCYATGKVSSNGGYIGGLLGWGYTDFQITNCYAIGDVSGSEYVGGLVGRISQLGINSTISVSNCHATGKIIATGNSAGGLVGGFSDGSVTKCYATGTVDGIDDVGGLIGNSYYNGIINCYATGSVSGNSTIGGLVGCHYYGSISNCYATGHISGNTKTGGFLGNLSSGGVTNCFFDYQTTGQIYGIGDGSGGNVTGKSTAEMKTKSTFTSAEWDFTTIWNINEGVTYPFFLGPVLIVSPTNHNFDKNYGYITIEITSNVEWTVTKETDWLSIYTTSGSNNGNFSISANQNNGTQRSTTVTVSGGGITQTINITQDAGNTSITEVVENHLQIYPNPTQNELFIKSDLQIEKVEIYTIIGNLVFSENNVNGKISVSVLPQGIYTLKVYTNEGMIVSKMMKK